MSNTTTERERLLKLMQTEGMNAKQFAVEVGIQAGTISNIVNGRNKPSLEVMQKVLHRFRTIQSDWLILGSGSMYRPVGEQPNMTLFDDQPVEPAMVPPIKEETLQTTAIPTPNNPPSDAQPPAKETLSFSQQTENAPAKKVEKIVIFYSDGTYEYFTH